MDNDEFTLGVEEEFFILDPVRRGPFLDTEPLLSKARDQLGDQVHAELQRSQLEVNTGVCTSVAEIRHELTHLRQTLAAVAKEFGAAVGAVGTHPFAQWDKHGQITPIEAYLRLERDYQQLAREQLICGCHVHVGISDPEDVVGVMNRVRPWLAPILALAANSPFWMETDTGYASYRTEVWRRWPMAGTPEVFECRADYDRLVELLIATRSIDEPARIYWDVRPSARFGTIEFRVTDVCLSVDEAVMVAGLIRGLARFCHGQLMAGEPLARPRPELLRAATWRAARHGLDGELLDVVGGRTVPARELIDTFLALVRPSLEDYDEWDEISTLVAERFTQGTGTTRQRRAFARSGRLEDVIDLIVAETEGTSTWT